MAKFSRSDIKKFFQDTASERLNESIGIRDEIRGVGRRGREIGNEIRRELKNSANRLVGAVEDTGKILNKSTPSLGNYLIIDATVAQYDEKGNLIGSVYSMPKIYFIEVDQNILSKLQAMPHMKTPATFYAMIKGEHGGRPDPSKVGDVEIPRQGEYIVVSNPTSVKVIQIPISETIDNPPPGGLENRYGHDLVDLNTSNTFNPEYYDDEPEPEEIRTDTARHREAHPEPQIPVNVPDEDTFVSDLSARRRRQGLTRESLRDMIREATLLGYEDLEGAARSEYYDDEHLDPVDDAMTLGPMPPDFSYSLDDSPDAMDLGPEDLDLYPSDNLGAMEDEMMAQDRYPAHHHDDDYSDLGDMDFLGDDLDTYNSGEDLVMERKKIRQMIADVLKQL